MKTSIKIMPLVLGVLLLQGCQSMGYGALGRDRSGYAAVIAESWKEQMLLNVVKLRYLDTPVFLDISSVVTSYSLSGDLGLATNIFPHAVESTNHGLSAAGRYSETPTISYAPLTGERLVNSLLRPIPPESIFALIGSSGRAEFILKASTQAVNGIYNNESTSPLHPVRTDPRFEQIAMLLSSISEVGGIGMRIEPGNAGTQSFVLFRPGIDEAVDRDIGRLKGLLGLDAQRNAFRLVFGAASGQSDEIALLTRSMQGVMGALAAGVEVPPEDVRDGRATGLRPSTGQPEDAPLMRVRASAERPADAFAVVQYHGHWFWIDDRDLAAKRMFRFLLLFSSMVESGSVPQAPLLMIPTR
jgi:hypothetical protein